jgi:protein phosphatase
VTERSGGPNGAADAEPRIEVGLATDVGQVRSINEDSILCEPLESLLVVERGLFCAVADGMGGHAAGEEASSLAIKVAHDTFYGETGGADPLQALRQAVAKANAAVYEAGAGKTGRDHMGTTLTAAVLFNRRVVVGHVGDSRCYLVRDRAISQISKDHSWVAEEVAAGRMTPEQARVNPRRNIITRALGLRPDVDVDTYEATLEPGNIIVICSDGLHGLVGEDEIVTYVRRLRPVDAVDALVQLANDRGGPDNISVVVARVMGDLQDEADTERGFPVLNESLTQTARADLSEIQTGQVNVLPPSHMEIDEPVTTPTPAPTPTLEQEPPAPRAPAPALDQAPAAEPAPLPEHETVTPRTPVSEQALARAAEPQRRGGRSGGMALLVVLVLLIILGATLGFMLFQWFIH